MWTKRCPAKYRAESAFATSFRKSFWDIIYFYGLNGHETVASFTAVCQLTRLMRLCIRILFVSYDFAITSSCLHHTIQTLGVTFEFVGNYASVDFHRRALICPLYKQKAIAFQNSFFVLFYYFHLSFDRKKEFSVDHPAL